MRRRTALAMLAALGSLRAPAQARPRPSPTPSPSPSPSPTASPTPLPESERFARMRREIDALSAAAPGRLGIAVIDVKQYSRYTARGDEAFPLASAVKLPLAALAYRRADQHRFALDARVEIEAADLRHGSGPIAQAHPNGGASYTYAELMRAMLIEDDDTATDALFAALGGPKAVDAFVARANLSGFDIRKTEADLYADASAHRTFARGGDNGGTPNGYANLLLAIASEELLHLDSQSELFQLLSESKTGEHRLRAGLPPAAPLAHLSATGPTFDGVTAATNDAGVLTLPDGREIVIVAFLAESAADLATREATLAHVARTVYAAYAGT